MANSVAPIDEGPLGLLCPPGYVLNTTTGMCDPAAPPISVTVSDVAQTEIDPSQFAAKFAAGIPGTNIIERFVTALVTAVVNLASPLITTAASLFDTFLANLSLVFLVAQGQRTQGYYIFIANLLTDLTGIDLDGVALYNDFKSKGRVASMATFGGAFLNAMASEMLGQKQATAGSAWQVTPGGGLGGLPDVQLSEAQGMDAGRALAGFAFSFAVREGNTDMLADYLPYGLGHMFKDFAEDFSKQIGLSRLLRVAIRPLFQTLAATPMQWALNVQYRPKLFDASEAVGAYLGGYFTIDQLKLELQRIGYSDAKIAWLLKSHSKKLSKKELDYLVAAGQLSDSDRVQYLQQQGWEAAIIPLLDRAEAAQLQHEISLTAAKHFAHEYITGVITSDQLQAALNGSGPNGEGRLALSQADLDAINALAAAVASYPRRTLTPAQMRQAFIDTTVTLQEYEDFLSKLGYSSADVTKLGIEAVIAAKKATIAAELAAITDKKAGVNINPPLAGL